MVFTQARPSLLESNLKACCLAIELSAVARASIVALGIGSCIGRPPGIVAAALVGELPKRSLERGVRGWLEVVHVNTALCVQPGGWTSG